YEKETGEIIGFTGADAPTIWLKTRKKPITRTIDIHDEDGNVTGTADVPLMLQNLGDLNLKRIHQALCLSSRFVPSPELIPCY
ncbi:MAG: hypothetical protein ACO28S_07780, partial [Bacteroidia bacterium]